MHPNWQTFAEAFTEVFGTPQHTPSTMPNQILTPTLKNNALDEALEAECRAHPLYPVLMQCIVQAMYGKGERHGGARTPFLEQPWAHYHAMHGRGFLTGQSAKKLEEAASSRSGDAFIAEVRGAVVYAGMALIMEGRK